MTRALANKTLKSWILGFNTNNWNDYIYLLADDYVFEVSMVKRAPNAASTGLELFKALKLKGVVKITTEPVTVALNKNTVVFEFEEIVRHASETTTVNFAISFDGKNGIITACREYYGDDGHSFKILDN